MAQLSERRVNESETPAAHHETWTDTKPECWRTNLTMWTSASAEPSRPQVVGDADLAERRLLNGKGNERLRFPWGTRVFRTGVFG